MPTHTWSNIRKEITPDMSDPATCLGAFSDPAADARIMKETVERIIERSEGVDPLLGEKDISPRLYY